MSRLTVGQRAQLAKALEWEKMRTEAIQRAQAQQQNDMARIQQLQSIQNAYNSGYDQYRNAFGSMSGLSASTTGAFHAATTTASIASDYFDSTASSYAQKSISQVVQKTWAAPRPATSPPATQKPPQLTWATSPLFGKPAFGRFYNWSFHSPFKSLRDWLFRWAWNTRRRLA